MATGSHESLVTVKKQTLLRYLLGGYTLKESAKLMELSYPTVRKYASDPAFLVEIKSLSKTVFEDVDKEIKVKLTNTAERLEEISNKALEKLEELLDSGSEQVRLKAIDSALDRNKETSRNKKVETEGRLQVLDPRTLVHAAETAQELADLEDASG